MVNLSKIKLGRQITYAIVGIVLLGICAVPAGADERDVCIAPLVGLTELPVIDGTVDNDNGWNKATVINLNADLGVGREAQLFIGRAGSDVYMGLIVDTPEPDVNDTILLAISSTERSSDADCSNDWKIHVKPFDTGAVVPVNGKPMIANFWRDSCKSPVTDPANWNKASAIAENPDRDTHWLYANTRVSKSGTRWQLEMKIPTTNAPSDADTAIGIPASGPFALYVNVLSTDTILNTVMQAEWPEGKTIPGPGFLTQLTPEKTDWGNASLNSRSDCTGLWLAWNQIGAKNSPPSEIKLGAMPSTCPTSDVVPLGPTNTFFAQVQNDMGVNAPDVNVKFSIANWGIPGATSWDPIPPGTTGTTGDKTVHSPAEPADEFTRDWALTPQQTCVYNSYPNQCLKVDIDSENAQVRFKSRGAQRNMDFVTTSSPFKRSAEISARGYGQPPEGRENQEFVINVKTRVQQYVREKDYYLPQKDDTPAFSTPVSAKLFPKGLQQSLEWVARGYLKTGKFIVINDHEYEVINPAGGFGYVVGHDGPVDHWNQVLTGETVKDVDGKGNRYSVSVRPEGVVGVTTVVTPETVPPCKLPAPCCRIRQTAALPLAVGIIFIGQGLKWRLRRKKNQTRAGRTRDE